MIDRSTNIELARRARLDRLVKEAKRAPHRMRDVELPEPETLNDMILAKNVGDMLERKYPGWLWGVTVVQGVVDIRAMRLSGRYGYRLHADKIDNDMRAVVRAGGEVLERHGMPRGRFDFTVWRTAPRTFDGHMVGDHQRVRAIRV